MEREIASTFPGMSSNRTLNDMAMQMEIKTLREANETLTVMFSISFVVQIR